MAYVAVDSFKAGLDRRGTQISGDPGSLWEAVNVHINRKGEVERRKKFVEKYDLPTGTHGLHSDGEALYVFGHAADPGVPAGVTYQRLQHPDGSTAMTKVWATENFDGEPYVVAEFTGGAHYHFYNGAIVTDWLAGIVRSDMTNNDGIAEHLKALIDASEGFSATRSGSVVTVTGADNEAFEVETSVETVSGGTDDQTLTANTTQQAVTETDEVLATCSFRVLGGTTNAGVNTIGNITVNSVAVIGAAVNWSTSNQITAAAVASAINSHTSSPNYTATASGDTVTISAAAGTGDAPNGFVLAVTATGDVVVTNGSFRITGGTASAGVNKITSITVNGVEIMDTDVDWTTSHAATAAAVAAQINTKTSSPEYGAVAIGDEVRIGKLVSQSSDSSLSVVVTVAGDVAASTPASVSPTATAMSGGVDEAAGQPQITTLTVGGTFEVGDKFSATLGDETFGYVGNPDSVGKTALTFKGKLYSTVSSIAYFSAVNDATVWNRDSAASPGANFVNLASQDEGSKEVYGLGVYQGNLAFFARNSVQIWSVDADEDLNVFLQPLKNTGSRAAGSIRSYGNNDLFYLADSGIRSIKARDSSNAAFVSDVGTPIDPLVHSYVKSLSASRVEAAVSILEPLDDRYWLCVGGRIFVFSYFPGAKISAWSYYDTTDDIGADITTIVQHQGRIYARAGDTVYLYGGDNDDTYPDDDEIEAEVTLPFLDANTPGTFKVLLGVDLACENEWLVELLVDPTDTSKKVTVGRLTETSFTKMRQTAAHNCTHFAPKLTCSRAGAAKLMKLLVHYNDPHEAG